MSSISTLRAESSDEQIALYRSGDTLPLLTQCAKRDKRPYIHPLLAPDGIGELTENTPGHHLWQHGLYVGLNDVNGFGFWTEGLTGQLSRDGTFHPAPLAPPTLTDNNAAWEVVTDWRTPTGSPLLREMQQWTLADHGATLLLDLTWTLRADSDIRFGKYTYGGLFLRMPWRRETHGDILTSEGADTHEEAEGRRARWIALSMPIPGRASGPAGIAILDHPSNPEHPAPWRVDNNLGIAPSRCIAGEWQLASGAATTSRYRLFIYLGAIDPAAIDAEWQRFTAV